MAGRFEAKAFALGLPSRLRLTRIWRLLDRWGVPVLILHGVLPDDEARYFNATGKFISPERLRVFMERLSRSYRLIALSELVDSLVTRRRLKNALVLTIDDGYRNNHAHAYPILRKMGIPFAVFVTTGLIDSDQVLWTDLLEFAVFSTAEITLPVGILDRDVDIDSRQSKRQAIVLLKDVLKRMTLEAAREGVDWLCERLKVDRQAPELEHVRFLTSGQIREMSDNGVEFGGHTVTHPILSRENPERIRTEVEECKRRLEAITGKQVTSFAYPNGRRVDFNETVKRELRAAGYVASFTGIPGLNRPGVDLLEIRRLPVDCRWTYQELETRVSGILALLGK